MCVLERTRASHEAFILEPIDKVMKAEPHRHPPSLPIQRSSTWCPPQTPPHDSAGRWAPLGLQTIFKDYISQRKGKVQVCVCVVVVVISISPTSSVYLLQL